MNLILETDDLDAYRKSSDIIDYQVAAIRERAVRITEGIQDDLEIIRTVYHFVRDEIAHSVDIQGTVVTCKASEALEHRQGICYAKAHLLAALLRSLGIPTGFCYQKLVLDDEDKPWLVLHGLNAVYIESLKKWIRLDARGNKAGVTAEFSTVEEKLAFEVRTELGEQEDLMIYVRPSTNAVHALTHSKTVEELLAHLPAEV
ncbi:transglutaminase domain-containing protein [Heliobacterium chlorum]|uniref:Transglutaminase domain-containing protein n=1 Tax=Heliobacterium chlorum TaxID=2698 RepID=A0ABR7T5Y4_HELCL|nr:transglutaminase-like domain-containing protein [Heliobacterium chlorum]MBC9786185.1 transglutaminase domain-containing protein [Heliobacterium chlorum]